MTRCHNNSNRTKHSGSAVSAFIVGVSVASVSMAGPFPPVVELSDLLPTNGGDGSEGFVMRGIDAGDSLGFSVSGAGDFDADGLNDLIVGARRADPGGRQSAGETYVVFGRNSGIDAEFDLSSIDGTNGVVLNGITADDFSGAWVSSTGDVNNDRIDDVIVGAPLASPGGRALAGQCYVVFGRATPFQATIDLSTLDGASGFAINGTSPFDTLGWGLSDPGDVNGDGIDDMLLGAEGASPGGILNAGQSYVVFGRDTGFSASIELSDLDGAGGFAMNGVDTSDFSGTDVGAPGDINGDGYNDVLIGARGANPAGISDAGAAYLVFGQPNGFPAEIDLSSLSGTSGVLLPGVNVDDRNGTVSGAGDINGDGLDDLAVGANGADSGGAVDAGESYVVFGRNTNFPAVYDLSALDGIDGFIISGINSLDYSGVDIGSAGDVNADGISDLIVSAVGDGRGISYVIYGSRSWLPAVLDLELLDGSSGFAINGVASTDGAFKVGGIGDFNGDGIDDLIIGAAGLGSPTVGETYVLFGRSGDADGDGITNIDDNCIFLSNLGQQDSNSDGIGNPCDPDIAVPNDCQVNFADLLEMKQSFFATPADANWNADADLTGGVSGEPDGIVNFTDLQRMKDFFFGTPGPSAMGCNPI